MRKIHVDKIRPGEINGKAIYTYNIRQRLLNKGVPIKPEYITRLKKLGINYIYIEDEISEGIELQEMLPEELQREAKECICNTILYVKENDKIKDSKVIAKLTNTIIDVMMNQKDLSVNITDIRAADDYTFAHSVSVCTLSVILGMALGLDDMKLRDLGIGALMHDVGKTKIPNEILNKRDKLTEEEIEIIKKHPEAGFEVLRKCDTLNRNSVNVALGHHERYDGSGYPFGLLNNQIHYFSKIVSVVDAFDAMNSDRVYRSGMETSKVVKYLEMMSNKLFDGEIVKKFIEKIVLYPNGSSVLLNTKEKAIVVKSNNLFKDKPVIRIYKDPKGNRYKIFKEIDLSKNSDYFIVSTCQDD